MEILFSIQLVLGSESEKEVVDTAIKDDPIIKELKNLLKYKSFHLLDTVLIRTTADVFAIASVGMGQQFFLELTNLRFVREDKEELISTIIRLEKKGEGEGNARTSVPKTRLINTTISFKPGEKIVVGVSKMDGGDKGLILIISGKVI